MLREKVEKIAEFIERWKDLPEQGTKEWEAIRGIGGSELKNLLEAEHRLVSLKVGLSSIPSSIAMVWGTVFEQVCRAFASELFQTSIHETSSVPSAEVQGKTYSMDGMGLVKLRCFQWNTILRYFYHWFITLFEFKCPYSRKIVQGEIYKEYIPQVKSGLCDLGIPEIGVYMEFIYRVCNFEDLGYNSTSVSWLQAPSNVKPIAWCFIGFYVESIDFLSDYPEAMSFYKYLESGQMDFAKLESKASLHRLFDFVKKKHIKCWVSPLATKTVELQRVLFFQRQKIRLRDKVVNFETELSKFYSHVRELKAMPMGIISIKLMDLNISVVEKEFGYTKKYEEQIHSALKKIQLLKAIEDPADRQSKWEQMYGLDSVEADESDVASNTASMADFF